MGTRENKATAVAVHTQALPGGHAGTLAAFLAPGFVSHDGAFGSDCRPGADGASTLLARMHVFGDAFEDQRVRVLHAVAEGDVVALHLETSARHTGYFHGVPPTGRRVVVREMHMLRFADGHEAEHWCVRDEAALLRALVHETAPALAR
ncbi:ester cyclase [Cellulosimicrobium arenosum]|uniref:Ester cyclase n=1 Tax=Cellulosimicrobium arenosum TaxID=2708133 RepID=A0A927PFD3_9MICO|nr:ester cyclase [Cellulosimicrobium arenosum]MBD8080146.1 ester cyclase [Cellulosimicrobium arenosum]